MDFNDSKRKQKYFENSFDCFVSKLQIDLGTRWELLSTLTQTQRNNILKEMMPFIANILSLMFRYLPFSDPVVNCIDFVSLFEFINQKDVNLFKKKLKEFNDIFKVLNEEDFQKAIEEVTYLMENFLLWEKMQAKNSSVHLWDFIEFSHGAQVHYLSQLIKAAHALPTSAAGIEQSFSTGKFIKNLRRTRLSEETFQSLLLIFQEYQGQDEIYIPQELIQKYKEIRKRLRERKSNARKIENLLQDHFGEPDEEDKEEDGTMEEESQIEKIELNQADQLKRFKNNNVFVNEEIEIEEKVKIESKPKQTDPQAEAGIMEIEGVLEEVFIFKND